MHRSPASGIVLVPLGRDGAGAAAPGDGPLGDRGRAGGAWRGVGSVSSAASICPASTLAVTARRAWSSRRRRGRTNRRRWSAAAPAGPGRTDRSPEPPVETSADSASCQVLRGRSGAAEERTGPPPSLERRSGGRRGELGGDRQRPHVVHGHVGAGLRRGDGLEGRGRGAGRGGGRQAAAGRAAGRDEAGTGGSGQPGTGQLTGTSGAGAGGGAVERVVGPLAAPRVSDGRSAPRRAPATARRGRPYGDDQQPQGCSPGPVRHCLIRRACPQ